MVPSRHFDPPYPVSAEPEVRGIPPVSQSGAGEEGEMKVGAGNIVVQDGDGSAKVRCIEPPGRFRETETGATAPAEFGNEPGASGGTA
jgi:hypothetical protein